MEPYFFEVPSYGKAYGVFHSGTSKKGVLLFAPLGQEYMRSHWAFKQLAQTLSRNGHSVFRFDYFGTGNSSGTHEDVTLDSCLETARAARNELLVNSACTDLVLIGLRAGALVASLFSREIESKKTKPHQLILWNPVIDGKQYISDLTEMQKTKNARSAIPRKSVDRSDELLGYVFSQKLREQFSREILIRPTDTVIPETFEGSEHPHWNTLEATQTALLAGPAIKQVVLCV